MARTINTMEQNSLDKLGTSFFEGVIYTQGNFTAGNDLRILGSLLAKGNITLQNGVTIVQIPELTRRTGQSLGTVVVSNGFAVSQSVLPRRETASQSLAEFRTGRFWSRSGRTTR